MRLDGGYVMGTEGRLDGIDVWKRLRGPTHTLSCCLLYRPFTARKLYGVRA